MMEGFTRTEIKTSGAKIVTVHGGKGPPLLLIHGNPFTHLSWHKFAPRLAQELGMTTAALRGVAIVDMLFFFGVLMVGFAYLWRFGYLDWVRSAATTSLKIDYQPGVDLRREARTDRAAI